MIQISEGKVAAIYQQKASSAVCGTTVEMPEVFGIWSVFSSLFVHTQKCVI